MISHPFCFNLGISLDMSGKVIKTGISQIILEYPKLGKFLQTYIGITQDLYNRKTKNSAYYLYIPCRFLKMR